MLFLGSDHVLCVYMPWQVQLDISLKMFLVIAQRNHDTIEVVPGKAKHEVAEARERNISFVALTCHVLYLSS